MKLTTINSEEATNFIDTLSKKDIDPKVTPLISSDLKIIQSYKSVFLVDYIFQCSIFRLFHWIASCFGCDYDSFFGYDDKSLSKEHLAKNISTVIPKVVDGGLGEEAVGCFVKNVKKLQESFSDKEKSIVSQDIVKVEGYLTKMRMNRVIDTYYSGHTIDFKQINELSGSTILNPSTGLSTSYNKCFEIAEKILNPSDLGADEKNTLCKHLKQLFVGNSNQPSCDLESSLMKLKNNINVFGTVVVCAALEGGKAIDFKDGDEDLRREFHNEASGLNELELVSCLKRVCEGKVIESHISGIWQDIVADKAKHYEAGFFANAPFLKANKEALFTEFKYAKRKKAITPQTEPEKTLFNSWIDADAFKNLSTGEKLTKLDEFERKLLAISAKKLQVGDRVINNCIENKVYPIPDYINGETEDKRQEMHNLLGQNRLISHQDLTEILTQILGVDATLIVEDLQAEKATHVKGGFFEHGAAIIQHQELIKNKIGGLAQVKNQQEKAGKIKAVLDLVAKLDLITNSKEGIANIRKALDLCTSLEVENKTSAYGFIYHVLSEPDLRAEMKMLVERHPLRLEAFFKGAFNSVQDKEIYFLFAEKMRTLRNTELNIPRGPEIVRSCTQSTTWHAFISNFFKEPSDIQKIRLPSEISDETYKRVILASFVAADLGKEIPLEEKAMIVRMDPLKYVQLLLTDPTLRNITKNLILEDRLHTVSVAQQAKNIGMGMLSMASSVAGSLWGKHLASQVETAQVAKPQAEISTLAKLEKKGLFPQSFHTGMEREFFKDFWNPIVSTVQFEDGFKQPHGVNMRNGMEKTLASNGPNKMAVKEILNEFFAENEEPPFLISHNLKLALRV